MEIHLQESLLKAAKETLEILAREYHIEYDPYHLK